MAAFRSIAEKAYRAAFEAVPSLSKARIASADSGSAVVSAVWEQHAVNLGETASYETVHNVTSNGDASTVAPVGLPVPGKTPFLEATRNNVCVKVFKGSKAGSPTEDVFSLHVFKGGFLRKVLNLNDLYGPVYMDSELGCLALNSDASLVAFVAEAKKPKTKAFFSPTPKKESGDDEDDANVGQEFRYRDEWGEQMVGKSQSVIVIANLDAGNFRVVEHKNLKGFCPGQLHFEGDFLVGMAVKTEPYRLGLVYCTNRPSVIFCVPFRSTLEEDVTKECLILSANDGKVHARCPRTDGNGNVFWIERNLDQPANMYPGAHQGAMRLMKCSLSDKSGSPVVLIEAAKEADDNFAGLDASVPERAFIGSEGRFFINSVVVGNCIYPMIFDVAEKKLQILKDLPRLNVLDVKGNWVLGVRSDPTSPSNLVIMKITDEGVPLPVQAITDNALPEKIDNLNWKSFSLLPTEKHPGEKIAFNAFYVGPSANEAKASVPLILFPHGGPHVVVPSSFLNNVYFFNLLGYGVLIVNYRGSLGAGDNSVASLLGHVGTNDVSDCMQALDETLGALPFLNPKAVVLFGGSHGGFLVTQLAGQHPDRFQAVVARNPVINIASMATVTDIPDWIAVESGQSFVYKSPGPEQLGAMFERSPIAHVHKVSAPVMLMIGKNDLRVPPSQGLEMYRALKSLGKEVEMNVYDDCHPLAKVPNNINVLINSAIFFNRYLQK